MASATVRWIPRLCSGLPSRQIARAARAGWDSRGQWRHVAAQGVGSEGPAATTEHAPAVPPPVVSADAAPLVESAVQPAAKQPDQTAAFHQLRASDLRQACKDAGIPANGTKGQMFERLGELRAQQGGEANAASRCPASAEPASGSKVWPLKQDSSARAGKDNRPHTVKSRLDLVALVKKLEQENTWLQRQLAQLTVEREAIKLILRGQPRKIPSVPPHTQSSSPPPPPSPAVPPLPPLPPQGPPSLMTAPQAWLDSVNAATVARHESVLPSDARVSVQEHLFGSLCNLVAPLGGELLRYGSATSELSTQTSDLDLTWIRPQVGDSPEEVRQWVIGELRSLLSTLSGGPIEQVGGVEVAPCGPPLRPHIEKVKFICASRRHGAPPVIRLEDASGDAVCDITMNNWDGLRNSALLRAIGEGSETFRPLGRVVKHWAQRRRIADRQSGCLSTYGLMLMVATTLQQRGALMPPAAIESICEQIRNAGYSATALDEVRAVNVPPLSPKPSEGELLICFFESWVGWANRPLVDLTGLQTGGASRQKATEVRCPLTGTNIEAQLTWRRWQTRIFPEFDRALTVLRSFSEAGGEVHLDELCSPLARQASTQRAQPVPPPPPLPQEPLGVPPLPELPPTPSLPPPVVSQSPPPLPPLPESSVLESSNISVDVPAQAQRG